MAAGLLLALCAAACVLGPAQAQDPYDQLPDGYKQGVQLALEQLNAHAGVAHHFRFFRSLEKSAIESGFGMQYLYHHFLLKPTRCAKGTTESSVARCPFRNDRPLMDCALCYKIMSERIEELPKPYVHCIQRPRLTQEMSTTRVEHCKKMSYKSGAPTLLASTTG